MQGRRKICKSGETLSLPSLPSPPSFSLPSPPLTSRPSTSFPCSSPLPTLLSFAFLSPLEVSPLNLTRGSGSAVSSPVGSGGGAPESNLVHFSHEISHKCMLATISMIFLPLPSRNRGAPDAPEYVFCTSIDLSLTQWMLSVWPGYHCWQGSYSRSWILLVDLRLGVMLPQTIIIRPTITNGSRA